MMICLGLLMTFLPFSIFMGLGKVLEVQNDDVRLLIIYVLAALVLTYLGTLGSCALIQNHNCKKINLKHINANAGIALAFQSVALSIAYFIPSSRALVTNLFPTDTDPIILTSIGYAYWSFWAGVFGIAIGGTLSGVCS